MAGGSVLALAEAWAASGDARAARDLHAGLQKATAGRDTREAALKAFKAVQQRLSATVKDEDAVQQLAAVGHAALAALAAGPATPAASAQLSGWRYNFARRLVSAKAYEAAHAEAWTLFLQLNKQQQASRKAAPAARDKDGTAGAKADAANLMVGTVLTLVLSCVEGKLVGRPDALTGVLAAVESLPSCLSQLGAEEAARHSEAAYKYVFKAGVALLEQQAWQEAAAVCAALLAAAGDEPAGQQRALAAVAKLAAHMPEQHGAAALAAVAAKASKAPGGGLSSGAASDVLSMLCSAVQRATCPEAAAALRKAVLSCAASGSPTLQMAPLLLPALELEQPPKPDSGWMDCLAASVQLVSDSLQQVEVQLAGSVASPPLGEQLRHLAVLEAACQPLNVLRRVLGAQLAGIDKAAAARLSADSACSLLGCPAAASKVATALELLPAAVGICSRLIARQGGRTGSSSAASTVASQGHAAAVALVTAARLRAACSLQQQGQPSADDTSGSQAASRLLGWDMRQYASASPELPPAECAVDAQELAWLASALFNVGLDLHASQQYAAAVPALQSAVAAAALGVRAAAEGDVPGEEESARLADVCRKCVALSDAQHQASDAAGALAGLGHAVALLLQLGFSDPVSWQPLLHTFVRLVAEAPQYQPAEAPAGASMAATASQPGRRARVAGGKKGAATAAAAAAADTSPGGHGGASAGVLLVQVVRHHEADLPMGSVSAVMEQELLCWGSEVAAAPVAGVSSSAVAAGCRKAVGVLLRDVFPAAQLPVQHAGALLAMHQAGLEGEDGQRGTVLLERAAAVLNQATGKEAAGMLARAQCLLAVESGRELARQALLEQQQERQRSHAAASTSAVGSREQDAAVLGGLADANSTTAAWQRVVQGAEAAVATLRASGSCAGSSTAGSEFAELMWLLGLHGRQAAVQQLGQLLPGGQQPCGDPLAACLFPAATASAAELQRQADAAATEASRSSAAAAMHRAVLHRQAAEASAACGDIVPALYHAAESHRLLAVLFHSGVSPAAATPSSQSSSGGGAPGWWCLAAAYLGSLLQLGQLFEAAGQAEEALHSLREGQRLAVTAGAAPVAAAFSARIADIFTKQGELAAAEKAVSAAEQQVEVASGSDSVAVRYCRAWVELARAQLAVAPAGGSPTKAVWQACQAAVSSCADLAVDAAEGADAGVAAQWCGAMHAQALLLAAEAARQREDASMGQQQAAAALQAAHAGGQCSALRYQRAAALLFLGQHTGPQAGPDQHLTVWGLGPGSSSGSGSAGIKAIAPAAKGRSRRQPTGRGHSRAAEPDEEGDCRAEPAAEAMQQQHVRQLWQALELSRGMPALHRCAALLLAAECGRLGHLHLAACLVHCSLGCALRLQYQLVLHSRRQQLAQRQRRAAALGDGKGDTDEQLAELERVAAVLEPGLDWSAVLQLAGCGEALGDRAQPAAAPRAKGRRTAGAAAAKKAAAEAGAAAPAAALAALEQQAQQRLQAWQSAVPGATATCSISVLPASHGGSVLISRLAPAGTSAGGLPVPPLLVSLPVQQLSSSLSQHPIHALRFGEDAADDACTAAVSSVQSVLDEMAAVLADSGRSMRELATETKEQQREWWRARLSLDDRLAALTKHLDSSWLGPWRCLLLGAPAEGGGLIGQAAAEYVLGLLEASGQPVTPRHAGVARHVASLLAQHARSMTPGELRQAAHQLCCAAGLACTQEQQHRLEELLLSDTGAAGQEEQQAADAETTEAPGAADAAPAKPKRGGKSVKFADADAEEPMQQQQQQQAEQQQEGGAEPSTSKAGRGRRAAPAAGSRSRRGAAAAAAVDEAAAASSIAGAGSDASPVATLGAVSRTGDEQQPQTGLSGANLCQVFDTLTLEEGAAPGTGATRGAGGGTTARTSKHRSRLRMLQAGTPGPATARKSAAAAAAAGAATAPRPAREVPLTVAKTAPPPAARRAQESAPTPAAGPVLLVLDGALQALPWESTPGLLRQRLYRMPSLACAAASAQRGPTSVDLSSTFYALNPSGDLAATQATFQDWFRGMKGWEGKAGSAPTAAELAEALQSHAFFLYCGHGGGEQYISVTKLRSLPRCSAALLMGCSSGRLRAQQHYDASGAVLAYLLAGCPAAVANLWDVTDRDIDRFSQALLTSWISGHSGSDSGSNSSGGDGGAAGADVSATVGASRAACKLPHLVGAAPVCYGLPSQVFSG